MRFSFPLNLGNVPNSKALKQVTAPSNGNHSFSSPSLKKKDDALFDFLNSNPAPTEVTSMKDHARDLVGPKTSTPRKPMTSTMPPPMAKSIVHPRGSELQNHPMEMKHGLYF